MRAQTMAFSIKRSFGFVLTIIAALLALFITVACGAPLAMGYENTDGVTEPWHIGLILMFLLAGTEIFLLLGVPGLCLYKEDSKLIKKNWPGYVLMLLSIPTLVILLNNTLVHFW